MAETAVMKSIDEISGIVVATAIAIHRDLGPGLLESVYEVVLAGRLEDAGLKVARQVPVPLTLDGRHFDVAFRIDILVEDRLILEIKAVEQLSKAHTRQMLTYLRLFRQPLGLLLNFSGATMKEGIRRIVNDYRPE
ncbi:GxxExxY protein [Alteraurantiacibacter palmitatis]|uniref:GxxExxY protein n=1 Tax=Alteraurantiacibacter palmitatis TaxID=2054628 RepID=A0ABV7E375_9SPHN